MTTITQRFDTQSTDFVEQHPLPDLPALGVGAHVHNALHQAVNLRQMVAVLGPKGIGKSWGLEGALRWFSERERRMNQQNNARPVRRIVRLTTLREDTPDHVMTAILKEIDARQAARPNGRKRAPSDLRALICQLMLERHWVGIAVDECEVTRPSTVDVLRDIMSEAAEAERKRSARIEESSPFGIGILLVGTPAARSLLHASTEYGHRLCQITCLSEVPINEAVTALTTWLPQAAQFTGTAKAQWKTFVTEVICRGAPTTMRHCINVVREYARILDSAGLLSGATGWGGVPIDYNLLRGAAGAMAAPVASAPARLVRHA